MERLSVLLDQSTAFDGHIAVWFNGVKLFDFANVRTGYDSGDMRWSRKQLLERADDRPVHRVHRQGFDSDTMKILGE